MTLGLPSICGTSVKLLHCPSSFNSLMNKIVMSILFGLPQVVATNGKTYVTLLKTYAHEYLYPQTHN